MNLITLDFETYYDKQYSLKKLTTEAYVRDPRFEVILVGIKINDETPYWVTGPHEVIEQHLTGLDIPGSFLLCHHTAFDAFILNERFGIRPRFHLDTMSMARPKHAQTCGVGLKALSDHYTIGIKGEEVHRAEGIHRVEFKPEGLEAYGQYCVNDVTLTYLLFQILKQEFPKDELKVIDLFIRMFSQPRLVLDPHLLQEHLRLLHKERQEILKGIEKYADEDALMSNQKFAQLLIDLGAKPPVKISPHTKKETWAFSKTDEGFRQLLISDDKVIRDVCNARLRIKSTIEHTRASTLLNISTRGSLPIMLAYYGAHTGRAAGTDGINPQNFPVRGGKDQIRRSIRAPVEFRLVVGDSAQIEARILAWLAMENDLLAHFARGSDIYSLFAKKVYGADAEIDKVRRHVGKTCILGLGYSMSAEKLRYTLQNGFPAVDLPLETCRQLVQLYRAQYRNICLLWNRGQQALESIARNSTFYFGRNQTLHTTGDGIHLPNGMGIRYPSLQSKFGRFTYASGRSQQAEFVKQSLTGNYDPNKLTHIYGGKVIENVVQALARIVVFEQMLKMAERYHIVLTVHDEIVACVAEHQVDDAATYMGQILSIKPSWAHDLPLKGEVGVGENYADAKPA